MDMDFSKPENWFWCSETERYRPKYIYPGMRTPDLPEELKPKPQPHTQEGN